MDDVRRPRIIQSGNRATLLFFKRRLSFEFRALLSLFRSLVALSDAAQAPFGAIKEEIST